MMKLLRWAGLAALLCATPALATTVMVLSVSHTTAQVVINKSVSRDLQIGEKAPEGVKLLGIEDGKAILRFDKQTWRMGVGETTLAEIAVNVSRDGAFHVTAYLNQVPVAAIIDTGASDVSLTSVHARQLGIDYTRGRRAVSQTANGPMEVFLVTIPTIQIGGIVVNNVPASVSTGAQAATLKQVLIGNSFLRHVHMQRSGDRMILQRGNGI